MAELSVPYRRLADTLLPHLAQFLELPEAEVERRMRGAREERNRRWIDSAPRTEAERNRLYAELGELDLLKYSEWHRTDEEKQGLHDELVRFAAKRQLSVLDCGGGIGDTTLAFAANGVSVTYIDFPGVCSRFARARQRLFGCEARVRQLAPEEFWADAAGSFDMVVSLDVLEHLENPVAHAVRYRDLLPSGGHLFVTTFFEHSARNPDHLPANDAYRRLFGGERKTSRRCVLTNLGFKEKRWYWFVKP